MSTTIDKLQIEIESSSGNAAKGIDDLAKSLAALKKSGTISVAVKNLNNLSDALSRLPNVHPASNALRTLANSIEKLKGVGSISGTVTSLGKLPGALKSLENIKLDNVAPQIQRIADAMAPLSAVKAGGLGTLVNGLAKLDKVTESLSEETITAFTKKVELLTQKLGPLSEKMTSIKAGFAAINSGARSASGGVSKLDQEVNTTTLNLANMITVIQGVAAALQPLIRILVESVSAAMEWDGIKYQFGNAFGEQADEYYEKITKITEALNINKQAFMENSAMAASMLAGFGVDKTDAREMGLGYTELAYDIWAAYNNVYKSLDGADGAMAAVRSAIAGEVEPIRRAGFTIVDSQLAITAANHGLAYSTTEATEAQKSYLRYLTLVDQAQSKGIVGTYAREMETAEGMMRTFSQQLKSLAQAFGSLFIPVLVKVMPYLQAFVELLTEGVHWLAALLGVEIQDIGDTWHNYSTGVGDAVTNTEGVTDSIKDATKAAKELKNASIGIDELNVISPPSASSDSGAGGGAGGAGGGYEGIDVGSLWDESIFDGIQQDVDRIKDKMRDWLPLIGSIATGLAGLRLVKLLKDIEAIAKLSGGIAAVGGALAGIKEFFKAAKQNAPEVGWFAALFPKLSTWIAGIPAALSSAASALAVAAPYLAIAAAVVGGIILAFVEYDFTEVGHTVGKKLGEALRNTGEFIWKGIKAAFNWVKDVLDIDDIWDVFAILFIPGEWVRRITPEITEIFKKVSEWLNGKIENLKGNINEFFDGFFDGFFEGLGVDMSWADKFTEIFDIEYLDIVDMVMNPSSIGKHIMTGIINAMDYNEKTAALKDKLSAMWTTAKNWWDKSKGTLKSYVPSIGSIKDKLSSAWTTAKNWWNKSRSSLSYTPTIGNIKNKLSSAWTTAKNWWNKSKGSMSYTPSIGSIRDKIKSAWNTAKSWWNKNVKLSTKLDIKVPKISIKWKETEVFGKTFKYPTGFDLKFAANGGIFDQGSLIWAGERGPEVMATASGGKTGVMNVQQMQDAVYEGVYAAVSAAMRGNSNGGGNQSVNVYLDGRQITATVEQRQRERGASIMGNEVYAY